MPQDCIFSWAENEAGKMVYVDDVPRGTSCGCICPYCHEKLLARHGEIYAHGFAHHSESRGANLKICYMVTMYKLAEQIIQTCKTIHAPSYYGIYKEEDIHFTDVKIDSSFERVDKQPDVIATTADNIKYLIEFSFQYKVQHKNALDYKKLNCIEVDLSNQTLETLENFLLKSSDDRKWLNNETCFSQIETKYLNAKKQVKIRTEDFCNKCDLRYICCAVKVNNIPLIIENGGQKYRICKIENYNDYIAREQKRLETINIKSDRHECKIETINKQTDIKQCNSSNILPKDKVTNSVNGRSCYNCRNNLSWANANEKACCGCYHSVGLPNGFVNPTHAEICPGYNE